MKKKKRKEKEKEKLRFLVNEHTWGNGNDTASHPPSENQIN